MLQSGLIVREVGEDAGGLLSLGTVKQRGIASMHVCMSAYACTFAGGKGNPREKGSEKVTRL